MPLATAAQPNIMVSQAIQPMAKPVLSPKAARA
jgi:hypothetical protein